MKLSEYAKKVGVSYVTAWRWYKAGGIAGYQIDTGTIIITEGQENDKVQKVAIYARVSSTENRADLDKQVKHLTNYCMAKGWQINHIVKELGSGKNEKRPKFLRMLADTSITIIIVESKERLAYYGFHYIKTILNAHGRQIKVVNFP